MGQADISSTRPFRAEDWWKSKAPLLMGFVYLFALWFDIPVRPFIPLSVLSIAVIIGFASFGYIVNDFFDKEKDRQAGKKNFLLDKSISYQLGVVFLSLTFVFFPWLYLPASVYSYVLIGFQLFLFLIYSAPPLRLKEKGAIGLIVDALYAHAVPVVLAAYTFLLASGHSVPWIGLLLLFIWQGANGIRNIVLHQSEDIDADIRSQTKNYTASLPERTRHKILLSVLLLELILSALFFTSIAIEQTEIFACLLLVLTFYLLVVLKFNKDIGKMLHSTWRYFPNNVYEKWLPALYLVLLSLHSSYFILFLLLHLAVFNLDFYGHVAKAIFLSSRWTEPHIVTPAKDFIIKYASLFINYLIYYALLLFGIDLKKENMSARSYFKKRTGKSKP